MIAPASRRAEKNQEFKVMPFDEANECMGLICIA